MDSLFIVRKAIFIGLKDIPCVSQYTDVLFKKEYQWPEEKKCYEKGIHFRVYIRIPNRFQVIKNVGLAHLLDSKCKNLGDVFVICIIHKLPSNCMKNKHSSTSQFLFKQG